MTVQSPIARSDYIGTGALDTYDFNFIIYDSGDLYVVVADTDGVETVLTEGADYTVTGVGAESGGTITLTAGNLASGYALTIRFKTDLLQLTSIRNQGPYYPSVVETAIDRLIKIAQQLNDDIDRGVKLAETETGTMTLPTVAQRAGALLGFDALGDPIASSGGASTAVSTFMATLVDDESAGALIETIRDALTALASPAIDDELLIRDTSVTAGRRITIANMFAAVNGLSSEAAVALTDALLLYDTSTSTADKVTVQNLLNAVNALAEDTAPDHTADYLLGYDASASAAKKIKINALINDEGIRQTVLEGSTDANGQADFLSAGTGLAIDLAATANPIIVSFANGEDSGGPVNFRSVISADAAAAWSLSAYVKEYLYIDRNPSTGALTYGAVTNRPPIYGEVFKNSAGFRSLLHLDNALTDEGSFSWSAFGSPTYDASTKKFGTHSLTLNGTTQYIQSTTAAVDTSIPWEASIWIYITDAIGAVESIMALNMAGYSGMYLFRNAAGNIAMSASSAGSAWDIANSSAGSTSVTSNQWWRVRVAWTGQYYKVFLSNDGAEETLEVNVASTTAAYDGTATLQIGQGHGAYGGMKVDEFRYANCVSSNGVETPPTAAFDGVQVNGEHWFDLNSMKMKVWDESTTTWEEKQRVFAGEAVTGAASITSVNAYALKGRYSSPITAISSGAHQTWNHYLGFKPRLSKLFAVCRSAEYGFSPGDEIDELCTADGSNRPRINFYADRDVMGSSNSGAIYGFRRDTTAWATLTLTKWNLRAYAERGW